jgi:hypothetical protein
MIEENFKKIISNEKRLGALEAMARGFKKAKAKLEAQGRKTPNIDAILDLARKRYALVKRGVEPSDQLCVGEKILTQEEKDIKWVNENL